MIDYISVPWTSFPALAVVAFVVGCAIGRLWFLLIEEPSNFDALMVHHRATEADNETIRAENAKLKAELQRVAPYLAIHGFSGYTMKRGGK